MPRADGFALGDEFLEKAMADAVKDPQIARVRGKHVQVPGPGGKPINTYVVTSELGKASISMLPCGARMVFLMTGLRPEDEALHARLLALVQCRPVPAQEAILGSIGIRLDVPGYRALSHQPLILVDEPGVPNLILTIDKRPSYSHVDVERHLAVDQAMSTFAKVTLATWTGDHVRFTAKTTGDVLVFGAARLVACPHSTTAVIAYGPDRARIDRVATQIETATCTPPGEHDSEWASAPAPH